mgnify:CR=1 FL=1|tara:strand:- start:5125 stop:5442 length:318 start_codon:yes stop_codon:yes gene_type:complete
MIIFYLVFSIILLQVISVFLPYSEDFKNKDSEILKKLVLFFNVLIVILLYNNKNIWINLVILLTYLSIIKMVNIEYYNIIIYPIFYVFVIYLIYIFLNKLNYNII